MLLTSLSLISEFCITPNFHDFAFLTPSIRSNKSVSHLIFHKASTQLSDFSIKTKTSFPPSAVSLVSVRVSCLQQPLWAFDRFRALRKGTTVTEMFQNLSGYQPSVHGLQLRLERENPPHPSSVCSRWFGYLSNYLSSCANHVNATKQIKSQGLTKIYAFGRCTGVCMLCVPAHVHAFIRSYFIYFITLWPETHSHNIMVIIELTNKVKTKETNSCV